jgi:hypothetical protein
MTERYNNFLLTLDSRDSINGQGRYGGPAEFDIQTVDLSDVIAFRVKDMVCENSFYNVTSAALDGGRQWNLTLDLVGNVSGAFQIIVPQGNYSIQDLLVQIASLILSATGTIVSATFNPSSQIITLAITGGTDATLTLVASYGWTRLGFTTTLGPSASLTANIPYELNVTQNIRLECVSLASPKAMASKPNSQPTITRAPVIYTLPSATKNGWDTVHWGIPTEWYQMPTANLSRLSFRLTDDASRDLILNRSYWSASLEFRVKKANN